MDPVPFDIERDLVTATMKKRRKNMLNYYQVRKAFKDSWSASVTDFLAFLAAFE